MRIMKRTLICLYLAPLEFACASPVFAADQVTPQPYPWLWWRELQWPAFGWVFPLLCFAMMVVMLLFMLRRGGMGCMWRGRSTDKSGLRDSVKRSWSGQSASALEILNERYAKGEIDKQEYEEKKAAIASSG
jgi:uncharacterized membrane protein